MTTTNDDTPHVIPEVVSFLRGLQRKGVKAVYLADTARTSLSDKADVPGSEEEECTPVVDTTDDTKTALAAVAAEVAACTQCGLHEGRTNTVFGTGDPNTKVMFIGEGPGRDEDKQGKPFVGRSGQLLTRIIEAIDMKRDDVYITNIVKCRPPNNRDPQEPEVRCCEQYLKRQIDVIKPRVICALGRVSAHWLLDSNASLASLRETDCEYQGIPVLVTYHPAALLRNPGLKKGAWEDFKRLKKMIVS